jgi:lon-related putative ATP-dependent protease
LQFTSLEPETLRPGCDPASFSFETTAELEPLNDFFGQTRARDALDFGVEIRQRGYNLFVLGPTGVGKQALASDFIRERATRASTPSDWCYVNNFDDWRKPKAVELPAGQGTVFARHLEELVEDIGTALITVFESEEYRNRSEAIEQGLTEQQEKATEQLNQRAREKGLVLIRTPGGITLAPTRDGKTLGLQEFQRLPEEERNRIQADIEVLQEQMRQTFREAPQWHKQTRREIAELNESMARGAIRPLVEALREKYRGLDDITDHLDDLERDVIANFRRFLPDQGGLGPPGMLPGLGLPDGAEASSFTERYAVNVLIDHADCAGAPVLYEGHPSCNNLVGRVEHRAVQGTLVTDFTMIRAGALHRANGGYLLLDAVKVLTQPFAWEALKRALKGEEIKIESLGESLGLISTAALEPQPVPLNVKIILLGEPLTYYLLSQFDPEFCDLFKVQVEFDDRLHRDRASEQLYAQMIASLAREQNLLPFDRAGVARVIDHAVRLVDDNEKLGTHLRSIADLLSESAFWARRRDAEHVGAQDVQRAIDAKVHRADRIRDRIHEEIRRGTIMIDLEGEQVGQVNALSVLMLGGFSFGRPSRITARVRLGKGQVVDIDREVELGGPIHSKGVLILSRYLATHYAQETPLSLSASLVFEQSYSGVDGDSASCAELCALLSAVAEVPIRQCLAITGSINQNGAVQAVGGVNDKIEGFFDVCSAQGLTGDQGVVIPRANVRHLMLREDVVEAVADGRFAVYAVTTVAEAIELLTGMPAGVRSIVDGEFPEGTINHRVENRLRDFSYTMHAFAQGGPAPEEAP